jgi:hypothetical protein
MIPRLTLLIVLFASNPVVVMGQDIDWSQAGMPQARTLYSWEVSPSDPSLGPDLYQNRIGQPYRWVTGPTQPGRVHGTVLPDVYGPGIGMDLMGRPVRALVTDGILP